MDLRILNNRFHVVDAGGRTYRFTKAGGANLTFIPGSSAYIPEQNTTRELAEAIQQIEARFNELDFIYDRFLEI